MPELLSLITSTGSKSLRGSFEIWTNHYRCKLGWSSMKFIEPMYCAIVVKLLRLEIFKPFDLLIKSYITEVIFWDIGKNGHLAQGHIFLTLFLRMLQI